MDAQKEVGSILEHPFDVCGHVHILLSLVFQTQVVDIVVLTLNLSLLYHYIYAVGQNKCSFLLSSFSVKIETIKIWLLFRKLYLN